jgi:hypothetical protein
MPKILKNLRIPNLNKLKAFELFLRIGGASSRPLAISIAMIYMPGVAKAYFSMVYFCPLIFKMSSLSDMVQYRRIVSAPERFETISHSFYFVILSRILIISCLTYPIAFWSGAVEVWIALSIFCISDSFLMFNEIRFLLSGNTLKSSVFLASSRLLQIVALLATFYVASDIVLFSVWYLTFISILVPFVIVMEHRKRFDWSRLLSYLKSKNRLRRYFLQLRKASVEIFSLAFFVMTPTLISLAPETQDHAKCYVIGFSICSFGIIIFRVLFFNDRIKNLIEIGVDRRYLGNCILFSFAVFLAGIASVPIASFFIDSPSTVLVLATISLSSFILFQLVNQALVFFLSARSINSSFIFISLSMLGFIYFGLEPLKSASYYLPLAVIAPAASSLIINFLYYRVKKLS